MTAQERLSNARTRIQDGHYEEALLDLIWFHENALLESPAWAGVRLSYALHDWIRLGKVYPPAMRALEHTRDNKVAGLLDGSLGKSAFRDAAAINEYLQTTPMTYALYRQLIQDQPQLATSCAPLALPAIVDAKDYQLAAHLIPDPEAVVRRESARSSRDVEEIKHRSYTRAPQRWAFLYNYLEDIQQLLTVLDGIGNRAEAARLKTLAISLIPNPSLRRQVQAGLVKRPRAPAPKR